MASVTALGLGKTMENLEAAIRGCEMKQLEDDCKAYFKQL